MFCYLFLKWRKLEYIFFPQIPADELSSKKEQISEALQTAHSFLAKHGDKYVSFYTNVVLFVVPFLSGVIMETFDMQNLWIDKKASEIYLAPQLIIKLDQQIYFN